MSRYKQCPECGRNGRQGMRRFENESLPLSNSGSTIHRLNGWRCRSCETEELDADSMARYTQASDTWILQQRQVQQDELRRIRRKLHLTQKEAAALTGGGHNAFSRYERGEAQPMPAVVNLFKLLDRHPDLLSELLPGSQQNPS